MSYVYGTGANANYSGRVLVYPDQVPFDTDILRSDQYRMVDASLLAQAILGLPSVAGGGFVGHASGVCNQQVSPDLTVQIGVCSIYSLQQMEPIAYGNLGPLSTPLLYKQFSNMIEFSSSTLGAITAPSAGLSQYYLIQGTPQTVQINSVNRPYYNAGNPSSPNFSSADDTEIDNIVFALVPGTPATTGLEAIPTPTGSGIGMFVIHVTNGQTTILNSDISFYSGSFISTTLTDMPKAIQNSKFTYVVDSGIANAYVSVLYPSVTAYTAGLKVDLVVGNNNTTASTLAVNGLSAKNIVYPNGNPLIGGEMITGMIAKLEYDGTNFQLLNSQYPTPLSSNIPAASAVTLTVSATSYNVTSLALPAGRWLVSGNAFFVVTGTCTAQTCWVNVVSATIPDASRVSQVNFGGGINNNGMVASSLFVTSAGSTTIYLSANAVFASGTVKASGNLVAVPY